jgi:hypothetical protein
VPARIHPLELFQDVPARLGQTRTREVEGVASEREGGEEWSLKPSRISRTQARSS